MRLSLSSLPLHLLKRETRQEAGEEPIVWALWGSQVSATTSVGT